MPRRKSRFFSDVFSSCKRNGRSFSLHPRKFWIRSKLPAGFCHRFAVYKHDISREIVAALKQRTADAVGVNWNFLILEGLDFLFVETSGGDDFHVVVSACVKRVAHVRDKNRIHAG